MSRNIGYSGHKLPVFFNIFYDFNGCIIGMKPPERILVFFSADSEGELDPEIWTAI